MTDPKEYNMNGGLIVYVIQSHPNRYGMTVMKSSTISNMCCVDMEDALVENFISIGEFDGTYLGRGESPAVNIFHCSPYPEGAVWDELSIKYCPFCSLPIEVNVTKEK